MYVLTDKLNGKVKEVKSSFEDILDALTFEIPHAGGSVAFRGPTIDSSGRKTWEASILKDESSLENSFTSFVRMRNYTITTSE